MVARTVEPSPETRAKLQAATEAESAARVGLLKAEAERLQAIADQCQIEADAAQAEYERDLQAGSRCGAEAVTCS
jgi:hypothetical protein